MKAMRCLFYAYQKMLYQGLIGLTIGLQYQTVVYIQEAVYYLRTQLNDADANFKCIFFIFLYFILFFILDFQ